MQWPVTNWELENIAIFDKLHPLEALLRKRTI